MDYEIFSRTIADRDHTRVCRFCLAENGLRRMQTKAIAQLFEQITNENLTLSSDHSTFVCNECEKNLRAAVKIRNDITEVEKCWNKYIDEMNMLKMVKIEHVDDEQDHFETVEMTIEPVEHMYSTYDDGYEHMDSRTDYANRKNESNSYDDGGSNGNYNESLSDDFDDNQENSARSNVNRSSVAEQIDCEHCNATGFSRLELRKHLQKYHRDIATVGRFQCDICQARYSSRYGIRTHMKRHMQGWTESASSKKIKRYRCSKCDERFSRKTLLDEHELRHSGAALHVCHVCGIGKRTKALMNTHLKSHNPDSEKKHSSKKSKSSKRYFTCWICPERIDFQTLDELKDHRKNLHHDFQCKFCKNGFMTEEALQSHIVIHGTQDRPHLCKICGGTFAKIGHLKSHIQGKHAEQKPFPCQKCPKGFVHRYQLQSHIRVFHDKIKAFECTMCPTSFGHAKSRVLHMRTVHNM